MALEELGLSTDGDDGDDIVPVTPVEKKKKGFHCHVLSQFGSIPLSIVLKVKSMR